MAKSRKFLTVSALGVAAFALIGAGASATFTASTQSHQTIRAGVADVVLTSPDVPGCLNVWDGCRSLTLPSVGPVGSKFLTHNAQITMHNVGDLPVDYAAIQLGETHANTDASVALLGQINVCIESTDPFPSPPAQWHGVEANGPLWRGLALTPSVSQNLNTTLAKGASAPYWVDFYAGMDSDCGRVTSAGGTVAHAWGVPANINPAGDETSFYTTPKSLTNAAMGGVVTPTLTFSYIDHTNIDHTN